ncbi:MAG: GNAT family N-acetyltransferase [Pseudomonadota bacterium]
MSVAVRPVVDADFAAWSALWTDYLAFYETERGPDVHAQTWARIMDPDIKMYSQVAEIDGEVVGIVNYVHHQYFWGPEDRIYLNDLFTVPYVRGKGVGRALIKVVEDHAKATGAGQVWWLTAESNTPARKLYNQVATLTQFRQYKL